MVTDLTASPKAFKDFYFQRNHIEIDIRNIKVVFDTESLTSKSVEMFRKELGMAMVAYNLVSFVDKRPMLQIARRESLASQVSGRCIDIICNHESSETPPK